MEVNSMTDGGAIPDERPVPERLRAAAEQAVKMFADGNVVHLKFDLDGVRWVDGYINRCRHEFPRGQRSGLVGYLGAFVGECIIATFGGQWTLGDHGLWGVQVTKHVWACPRAKIEKQFENGPSDSVAGFVEFIPLLDKGLESGAISHPPTRKLSRPPLLESPTCFARAISPFQHLLNQNV
jgi:hypothetical protein